MEKVALAVVGVKGIGRTHIAAIGQVLDCELRAVCDIDKELASAASGEFGVPAYTKLAEMLEKETLDGITICTPHWFHPPIAVEAMKAGVHALTEKPMAVTVEGADKMIRASKETGRVLAVVFHQRTFPQHRKAKEIVASGRLGELMRLSLVSPGFRNNFYYKSGDWRGTWSGEGGGVLLNQAPHNLDLFVWISGMTPELVTGRTETVLHPIEVEDRASALLQYGNGATGYVHVSTTEAPGGQRMELAGDKGVMVLEGNTIRIATLRTPLREFNETCEEMWASPGADWEEMTVERVKQNEGELVGHPAIIADFCEAIRTGREPLVTGEDGIRSLELANAMILSSQRGEPVRIPVPRKAYSGMVRLLAGKRRPRRRRKSKRKR